MAEKQQVRSAVCPFLDIQIKLSHNLAEDPPEGPEGLIEVPRCDF